ncbi:NADP-dependent oxidoreductase [Amycolatopsis sp. cmx-11-51]|uniref:NADP-dependent oxidoreductase n=1 Tax=Amycolatopsis sp. cmx-11-51 TaxID=2785797 RepID=UPI0039E2E537
MRAIVYDRYGPPEVLRLAELPDPEPGPGQVRIQIRVAGVNPVDAKSRGGAFASPDEPAAFPRRVGNEYAGLVDALGPGVTALAVGEAVLGSAFAQAYAELIVADADAVVAKPDSLDWALAGALPAAGQTAAAALTALTIRAGDTLLVHGAAGGVGTVAVQLARLRGATVIGTASPANHDYLRALGIIPVAYGDGLVDRVATHAPGGVDAALDLVGGESVLASLALGIAPTRIGTTVDTDAVRSHGIQRVGGRSIDALREVTELASTGTLRIPVDASLGLGEAAEAHRRIERGHTRGKVALHVN